MHRGKKILAIVPARGGSKGIKLKNLLQLNGKSLVAHAAHIAQELTFIDRAIISTDHDQIALEAQKHGLCAPFKRPEELSGDRVSDWQVMNHALCAMEIEDQTIYDIVILLPPTSPMRKAVHVKDSLNKLLDEEHDAVWTLSETDSKGHPLKQLNICEHFIHYYDEAGADIIARQELTPTYHRNGAAYVLTRDCILQHGNTKGKKTGHIVIKEFMVNIDTQLDLEFAEFLLSKTLKD
jgi:CMP-N,N'-diacetyllegionaminic acid synthase